MSNYKKMKKAENWAKKRLILQNGSSKMKKDGNFDIFLQEKCTFSADYLVVSEKSSIFACFFAVRRPHACVYTGGALARRRQF